ncbi:MAG: hypothetical protein BAJALOKI1v1_200016 [Promethearchaeota archaeon]|nr:MAG: hypothetical protein BAJALOKI1v1_200016 [Candidatus Lokiarchaeota archaeon]
MTTPISSPSTPINPVQRFEDFYRLYEETPGEYKYQDKIKDIDAKGGYTLNVLYEDLLAFDPTIADKLKNDPETYLEDAVKAFKNILKFQSGTKLPHEHYFVRIFTKDEKTTLGVPIRGLRSKNIDKFVWLKGITIRSSAVRPKLKTATFECLVCGATFEIIQLTSSVKWPRMCTNKACKAKAKSDFRLITKMSEFVDWQSISIQEIPEDLPPGRMPRSVQAILKHDLVDSVKPGDRVNLMGVFKSVLATSIRNQNSTLFKTFIEVNYIDPEEKSEQDVDLTKEEKEEIVKLAKEPMIQKKIARSIAPTIYGRDDLKMACALSLFGGTKKKKPGGGYKRGDIHILFVGDPGTGKSVHGSEEIYVGKADKKITNWRISKIGKFIDNIIEKNKKDVKYKGDSEILKLIEKDFYTYSINTQTLKTQKSKIREVSRHNSDYLVQIETKSGRMVLATPNHSFTTIDNGKLEVLEASELIEGVYLPIARNLELPEVNKELDLSLFLNQFELVHSNAIMNNISSSQSLEINLTNTDLDTNITKGTIKSYIENPLINFERECIRLKYDTSWIPRKVDFNESFGRIVGFFLAEGDVIKNSIRITNFESHILDLIENDFFSLFKRVSRCDEDNTIQFHNASLAAIFKNLFGTGAENKRLPESFFFTPESFRQKLLSAYFTGDAYIKKEGLYISALSKSKLLSHAISDLLASVGIFATIRKKIITSREYKGKLFYEMILTDEEVIKFYKKIGFLNPNKQKKLLKNIKKYAAKSRYHIKDIIPNFGDILRKITDDLGLKGRGNSRQRNFLAELRGKTRRQQAGRIYLKKKTSFMEDLYDERNKKPGPDFERLKTLTHSDIFWDKIERIEIFKKKTNVYDIGTDDGHFILAKGNLIVHNSEILKDTVEKSPRGLYTSGKGSTAVGLTAAVIKDADTGQMNLEAGAMVLANGGIAAIDEFDKMDSADRSALHEAMEQQSYHYNTEILTSNGKRIIIGEFIDELIEKNRKKVIWGKDCEILDFNDLQLYSTDFNKIYKKTVDRVSRHKAPEYFYRIKFTNGRIISVTPEHPIFVFRNGKIKCINAEDIHINDFIPIPKYLPNSSRPIDLEENISVSPPNAKELFFPNQINPNLSRILGYLVSEGHSYKGSGAEVEFSNMDSILLNDFEKLMGDVFDIYPSYNQSNNGLITLRYNSIELYKWMKNNFPEIMTLSIYKRIPSKILAGSSEIGQEFLKSAFKGDGSVESSSICYNTSSKGLSRDYQDLLLKLGIHSRIVRDKLSDSYKVCIRGQSLGLFYEKIVENDDHHKERIKELLNSEKVRAHHHDIFPTSVTNMIIKLKKNLAISNDGYFNQHIDNNYGITRNILQKELKLISEKFFGIESLLKHKIELDIREIREKTGYSQSFIAQISGLKRRNIDYYERGGYSFEKRNNIKHKVFYSLRNKIKEIKRQLNYLFFLLDADICWDRIETIKKVKNEGKNYSPWVYDITIEPNHTFISQGVILHNTISIAKAGIVATLKAETAVIAAANPHSGRYDIYKTPTQNIRLPPSLLSRFDLIFVVIDRPNKADDAQMAEYILQTAMASAESDSSEEEEEKAVAPISHELMKKYIKYSKRNTKPVLTKDAKERIKEFYLELRGEYESEDAIVSILARNLDGLVRLSEAYAKMALREKVLKEDVEEIIKLFKRYLKDTGYDETTGKIDMDRIFVGESRSKLNKLDTLMTRLKEIFEENKWKMLEIKSVIQILELEENLDREFIKNAIDELIKEGTLYSPKIGHIKFTKKQI